MKYEKYNESEEPIRPKRVLLGKFYEKGAELSGKPLTECVLGPPTLPLVS